MRMMTRVRWLLAAFVTLGATASGPATAYGSTPSITMVSVSQITDSGASFSAVIQPGGPPTSWWIEVFEPCRHSECLGFWERAGEGGIAGGAQSARIRGSITGLEKGELYEYRVSAYNKLGAMEIDKHFRTKGKATEEKAGAGTRPGICKEEAGRCCGPIGCGKQNEKEELEEAKEKYDATKEADEEKYEQIVEQIHLNYEGCRSEKLRAKRTSRKGRKRRKRSKNLPMLRLSTNYG